MAGIFSSIHSFLQRLLVKQKRPDDITQEHFELAKARKAAKAAAATESISSSSDSDVDNHRESDSQSSVAEKESISTPNTSSDDCVSQAVHTAADEKIVQETIQTGVESTKPADSSDISGAETDISGAETDASTDLEASLPADPPQPETPNTSSDDCVSRAVHTAADEKIVQETIQTGVESTKPADSSDISGAETDISGAETDISGAETDISGADTDASTDSEASLPVDPPQPETPNTSSDDCVSRAVHTAADEKIVQETIQTGVESTKPADSSDISGAETDISGADTDASTDSEASLPADPPQPDLHDQVVQQFTSLFDEIAVATCLDCTGNDTRMEIAPDNINKLGDILSGLLDGCPVMNEIQILTKIISTPLSEAISKSSNAPQEKESCPTDDHILSPDAVSAVSDAIRSWNDELLTRMMSFLSEAENQVQKLAQPDTDTSDGKDSSDVGQSDCEKNSEKEKDSSQEKMGKPLAAVSNKLTGQWLALVFLSFFVKSDKSCPGGVAEIIRKLHLDPNVYKNLDDVFRSHAIDLKVLEHEWFSFVIENMRLYTVANIICLTGDGVNTPKEGRHIPGTIRIHKESGTQSKPSSFHGIHTGNLGILTLGANHGIYNTPLTSAIMAGLDPIAKWDGTTHPDAEATLEMQEIHEFVRLAKLIGRDAVYLTDRASMNNNVIETILKEQEELVKNNDGFSIRMITPVRTNVAAYNLSDPKKYAGRGPHAQKGDQVSFEKLAQQQHGWSYRKLFIYGKKRKVRFKCMNLLWGHPLKKLRFVLCDLMNGNDPFLLVCTDLKMPAADIIRAYALRFLCEESFRVLKHTFHAYNCHFWSKHMPRLSFHRKKGSPNLLESVESATDRQRIIDTIQATELYLVLGCIAQGIAQYIAMQHMCGGVVQQYCQVRSKHARKVSEDDICTIFTDCLPLIIEKYATNSIIQLLLSKQRNYNPRERLYALL